jgi:hypothetical protein
VPNDARLAGGVGGKTSDGWNSIVLCTGANACGKVYIRSSRSVLSLTSYKSVYLKQVCDVQSSPFSSSEHSPLTDCGDSIYGTGTHFMPIMRQKLSRLIDWMVKWP